MNLSYFYADFRRERGSMLGKAGWVPDLFFLLIDR